MGRAHSPGDRRRATSTGVVDRRRTVTEYGGAAVGQGGRAAGTIGTDPGGSRDDRR